ncbi:hypothetical protein [Alicyclobacillus acidiphilus]|nr:hypothetical protein [Alicyclobacillus acidiphilus]
MVDGGWWMGEIRGRGRLKSVDPADWKQISSRELFMVLRSHPIGPILNE